MFKEIAEKMTDAGIIPVVTVDTIESTLKIADTAVAKGLKALEITYRTTEGECGYQKISQAIVAVKERHPELLIGAGTVINEKLAEMAKKAGAEFVVSPGLNPKTVEWCIAKGMPVFPGVATPSDIEVALSYGLTYLKFFPAEAMGGTKMLKALSGPFPMVKFMPTGGINESNCSDYQLLKNVFCIGGSWVLK